MDTLTTPPEEDYKPTDVVEVPKQVDFLNMPSEKECLKDLEESHFQSGNREANGND
jgi:hypothetical protein